MLTALAGCAAVAPDPAEPDAAAAPVETGVPTGESHPTRDFDAGTLYELLVAEFAGIRNQVDAALEIYMRQAYETRDPAVIDRAIRIASYLNRDEKILELSELWVEVEPDNLDARRLVSFHLARAGRVVEAFPHSEYLLLAGDDEYLQSLAAFAEPVPRREKERLLALYRELERKHPDNTGLLLGEAMLLRQLNAPDKSLAAARRVIELEPANETAQLLHAQLLHESGQADAVLKSLRKSLRELPGSKRLRLQYARLLADEDLAASREQIRELVSLYPDDPELKLSLALISKEMGNDDEAATLLNELIRENRRASAANFHLGRLAEENGRFEDALHHYTRVRRGQYVLTAADRAARMLKRNAGLPAARVYLNQLRNERPGLATGLYQIEAELLIGEENLDEAREVLGQALDKDPDNISLLYTRSVVGARQGDLEKAESDLRAILAREPDNATALNALGYTLLNLSDRYREAYELIRRARQLKPEDPAITDSLGWVYYRLGDYDKALKYLREAFEAFPDPEVAAHLGEVLWVTGKKEEARRVWDKALEESPGNTIILETRDRLQSGQD